MNNVWPLGCWEDGQCDIEVFIPGPPGPPIVDVGTFLLPTAITATIAAPVNRRQRSFLKSSAGNLSGVTIPNPGDNGPWELFLYWADPVNTLTMETIGNIKLSGQWLAVQDSILYLQWDGNSRYVEAGRNEI